MDKEAQKITFELLCEWKDNPPTYRVYVDNELMQEREYVWNNEQQYVVEMIPVHLDSGEHSLNFENLNEETAEFVMRNFRIDGHDVDLEDGLFVI